MCLWLIIVYMKRTESENCISKLYLGLNLPIKLNETLIDSSVVVFRLPGSSEAFLYKITFGRIPERVTAA